MNNLNLPPISVSGDLDFEEDTSAEFSAIPAVGGLVMQSGTLDQDVYLYNPTENQCNFVISLYLSDGTLLYKSEMLRPGESIENININKKLNAGLYRNVILAYECCGDDGVILTRVEFTIEISCEKTEAINGTNH